MKKGYTLAILLLSFALLASGCTRQPEAVFIQRGQMHSTHTHW